MHNLRYSLFILLLPFLLNINVAQGFSLDEAIEKIQVSDGNDVIGLGDLKKEFRTKADNEIAKIRTKIDAEINKVTKQVDATLSDVNKNIAKFQLLKDKINNYIKIIKILSFVMGSSIIILIFIIYKLWRRIQKLTNFIANISNLEKINNRITALETKSHAHKK
jgi:hypothetical protein